MVYVLLAIGLLLALFVWWRWTSVRRGARKRDERILQVLDPVGEKLSGKQPVEREEVRCLALERHVRPMLYSMLKHFERLDLFPKEFLDVKSQAEAVLAYWLMHPNELQDPPAEMELVETVAREVDGDHTDFFVLRFKMAEGHWAAKDGWLLGLAGPFIEGDVPYSGVAGAFARCGDRYGETKPEELVDWYVGMAKRSRLR